MSTRRILLTGPTGLVGTAVLSRLLADGHQVLAVSRNPPPTKSAQLTWITADLADGADHILAQTPELDAVVHFAATIRVPEHEDPGTWYTRLNTDFSRELFAGCARDTIETVVYASGLNFLRHPLESVITEEHPIALTTPYGASKYLCEQALFELEESAGYRAVSLRLPSPIAFDPSLLHRNVVKIWIEAAKRGEPIRVFGEGSRTQNFVATVDIAEAVALSLSARDARGVFNIASETPLGMRELAELIASRSGATITYDGSDPKESERWDLDGEKAATQLGFVPRFSSRSAIETLLDNVAW